MKGCTYPINVEEYHYADRDWGRDWVDYDNIKPCPLCQRVDVGKTLSVVRWTRDNDYDRHRVKCLVCTMYGPIAKEADGAARLWNDIPRASLPHSVLDTR